MSLTGNIHTERHTYRSLDRRTVAKIRGNVIERGNRNAISRVFHSKADKDAIAAWRQDLIRILQIFNVRSGGLIWRLLRTSLSDGAVDGYPCDRCGYQCDRCGYQPERHVSRPGRFQRSKCISEYGPLLTNNGTLIVSQTQARSAMVNTNGS